MKVSVAVHRCYQKILCRAQIFEGVKFLVDSTQ